MWPHLEPGVEAGGVEVGVPGPVAAPPRPHVVGDELGDGGVPGEAQELLTPSLSSPGLITTHLQHGGGGLLRPGHHLLVLDQQHAARVAGAQLGGGHQVPGLVRTLPGQQSFKRRFTKISHSRRRPLLCGLLREGSFEALLVTGHLATEEHAENLHHARLSLECL